MLVSALLSIFLIFIFYECFITRQDILFFYLPCSLNKETHTSFLRQSQTERKSQEPA
jgi:hypothetical protein